MPNSFNSHLMNLIENYRGVLHVRLCSIAQFFFVFLLPSTIRDKLIVNVHKKTLQYGSKTGGIII